MKETKTKEQRCPEVFMLEIVEVFYTMAAKKKGLGRIRIKSAKRIILSAGLIIVAAVVVLVLHNTFSSKNKEVIVEPVATASPLINAVDATKTETTPKLTNARTSDFSYEEARKEISKSTVKNKNTHVKVINYSRKEGLAERIRAGLEINGYVVSAGNDKSLKRISSVIIEKKENISGEELIDLIKIRKVRKEIDSNSKYDIIVILGDDYNAK